MSSISTESEPRNHINQPGEKPRKAGDEMTQSETRYEIMECEDEHGFLPTGESEWTLAEAEARLQKLLPQFPHAFICEVVTSRLGNRHPEVIHELQTIPTAG